MTFVNHGQFDNGEPGSGAPFARNALPARLPRANTFLGADLQWAGLSRRCQVRDLSEGGALLAIESPPPMGTRALLIRGPHRVAAGIVWSEAKRCGLRFEHPVVVADVISGKGAAQPAPTGAPDGDVGAATVAIGELCSRADRLAAAIGQVPGIDPLLQADMVALAHALHRIRAAPGA
ncbi:PilZ domain-containing protein [Sphingomonas sp. ID1715]|uniref:PilZ domain-containing protein n=1 Tax=Sphingomonas sp. ID1715 TaxID=1656898 RepID=UPI001488C921|nr:PilZ domain-containing protein [Sphingomonas sp. ID1715]NNM75970.1 PilZ domain-containing protein [Sphingomonas sp. ID1715]